MLKKYNGELLLAPCPTVLVTAKHGDIENVLTVSWTGIASSHPEYVTISINPKRFSHKIILNSKKFCISIPGSDLIDAIDVEYDKYISRKVSPDQPDSHT